MYNNLQYTFNDYNFFIFIVFNISIRVFLSNLALIKNLNDFVYIILSFPYYLNRS